MDFLTKEEVKQRIIDADEYQLDMIKRKLERVTKETNYLYEMLDELNGRGSELKYDEIDVELDILKEDFEALLEHLKDKRKPDDEDNE